MEFIQEVIAHNLAHIRKKRGLSLDKVAELTGVSKAMLAQIEHGKSNPTVTTLWKIANGLQVSFSTFLKEADGPIIEKINIDQLKPIVDDDDGYFVYSVFPYHPEKKFEMYAVKLYPGYEHQSEKHLGEEHLLVQQGQLTLELQGEQMTFTDNDMIRFPANTRHRYMNTSNELVRFFVLLYYQD
ncbi:helix-turn-helix domain-containing protein [Bacillaceae bacterium SIJ1]|uniref:helix-turn-helix domain-containing protein n=1 Tax=Litoribacterium kuwaitense TaxID=1398745 RepID=UPI0013E9C352|nr:helix-turn-helix transcriptional regulator [Litoribacterium kuwaitense]NGP44769.1 helix-turn-helix domain-containing protein [Litoribacterium kuwaitense]